METIMATLIRLPCLGSGRIQRVERTPAHAGSFLLMACLTGSQFADAAFSATSPRELPA
jgi:hypothetical protein